MLHVVFSSHNGRGTLAETLAAYSCQQPPSQPWRIVAVDNASTDGTGTVLIEFAKRLPLVALQEPRPGKNVALNTALRWVARDRGWALSEDIFVFSDDDAPPRPGFLTGWEAAFREHPEATVFGGLVIPRFIEEPPDWLAACTEHHGELFARNDRPEGPLAARHIFGPNMAVAGRIIAAGHRFNEAIGPDGSQSYAMGSETEFCVRIERETGATAWFTRSACVDHLVRPWQMTRQFFTARAYRHGRGTAQQQDRPAYGKRHVLPVLKADSKSLGNGVLAVLSRRTRRHRAIWQAAWWKGFRDGVSER